MAITEVSYNSTQYRLRASNPMPVIGHGNFVLHTFMAESSRIEIIMCTEELPASSEFRGQGGELMNANFSRLNVKDGNVFSGKKVYNPEYVEEEQLNVAEGA